MKRHCSACKFKYGDNLCFECVWFNKWEPIEEVKDEDTLYITVPPHLPYTSPLDPADLELLVKAEKTSQDQHYQTAVQPIETMQANMSAAEFVGFLKGNIIKYACRCGRKDEAVKEAEKIRRYAGWLVQALNGETIDPRKDEKGR